MDHVLVLFDSSDSVVKQQMSLVERLTAGALESFLDTLITTSTRLLDPPKLCRLTLEAIALNTVNIYIEATCWMCEKILNQLFHSKEQHFKYFRLNWVKSLKTQGFFSRKYRMGLRATLVPTDFPELKFYLHRFWVKYLIADSSSNP